MSAGFGSDPFYAACFPDPLHAYVTGNNNDAWRSTDGGGTWTQMTSLPAGSWSQLDFLDATTGFAGANGACAFTSNGGANWVLRSGYPSCPVIYGMDFRDAQTGLVGGQLPASGEAGIYKTTDGGVSWVRRFTAAASDVVWMSGTSALAAVGTSIYRSTNAGDSWVEIASGIETGLMSVAALDASTLLGVSSKGDVWRSADGGSTWTWILDGLGSLPAVWSIGAADPQAAWVVGPGGMLLQTSDAGLSWIQRMNGTATSLYDIVMRDERYGLAAGHDGYLLRTTNGGALWETQKLEVTGQIFGRDEYLRAVSIVDDQFAVTAGPGGTVFRTQDGGATWESIGYPELPGLYFIEDVEFVSRTEGWLVGLDQDLGHTRSVYRTTDGGDTWTPGMSQNSYMFAVDFVGRERGWIATIGPLYFRTTDAGASWTSGLLPAYFTTPTVSDMEFADENVGWAVGWDGFVARTTNGGQSWFLQDIGSTEDILLDIHVVNANEAWAACREKPSDDGAVYHTTNGGATWQKEVLTPFPYVPAAVTATAGGSVWLAGYAGRIVHQRGAVVSVDAGLSDPEEAAARGVAWLLPNVPNPFRTSTTIRYDLPAAGRVLLEIFDVEGRRVETLVDSRQARGTHETLWAPASSARRGGPPSSAVYFCRLKFAGGRDGAAGALSHAETRRVILLR